MTLPLLTEYRQSTLRSLELCPRRTRFALEAGDLTTGWTEGSADLGTVFHVFAFAYLETLKRPDVRGARQMATEDAVNVMREVYASLPIVLTVADYEALVGMVCRFCEMQWDVRRILFHEEPLRADLVCPDGEVRTLKGQPDLVYADAPYGAICFDWKSGMGKPKSPKKVEDDGATVEGKQYLSDAGRFQRIVYGALILLALPSLRYALLWEVPMRFPSYGPRVARLDRSELEHVLPLIAAHMQKLDEGLREGPQSKVWAPKNGSHCLKCEAQFGCPVPPRQRGAGVAATQVDADILARRYVRGKAMYEQAAEQLKARQEIGGSPGRLNAAQEVRWGPEPDAWMKKGGGRKFGVHERVDVVKVENEETA